MKINYIYNNSKNSSAKKIKKTYNHLQLIKSYYLCSINITNEFYFMSDIFAIREFGVCRKANYDAKTAFTYYDVKPGDEIKSRELPLNYIIFILNGVLEIDYNEFNGRRFQSGEMAFLLRSSSVHIKVLKKASLYVFYFDIFLSSCDRQLFKAYLPDVEKIEYDYKPTAIPKSITLFLNNTLYFQKQNVDCMHFNSIKHRELFILLRNFCPREDIVMFFAPLISHSLNFRTKVLEKFMQLKSGRVTEFADIVGMGRKNFDKQFKKEFGVSPAKWMQQEKAKRLRLYLTEPDVTISDAMDKFHFNSPSHFNRFCHQYFKTSPGMIIAKDEKLKKKNNKDSVSYV